MRLNSIVAISMYYTGVGLNHAANGIRCVADGISNTADRLISTAVTIDPPTIINLDLRRAGQAMNTAASRAAQVFGDLHQKFTS